MVDASAVVARVAEAVRGNDALAIDDLLTLLPRPLPSDLVKPLLETLIDEHEFDEALWGILHVAESVESGKYEPGLLDALPLLARDAPGWARLLVLRCMNSAEALGAIASLLPEAPRATREEVTSIAEDLGRDDPARFGHAANVIAVASIKGNDAETRAGLRSSGLEPRPLRPDL